MKQYCRYCAYCVYGDAVYCEVHNKTMSEQKAKCVNKCKNFTLNELDVFNIEHKYTPRAKKKDDKIKLF